MSRHHAAIAGRRWQAARRAAFKRDGYRCTGCGRHGRLEAHHIERLADGGAPYALENIATYCRACHIALTRRQNRKPDPPRVAAWRGLVTELMEAEG